MAAARSSSSYENSLSSLVNFATCLYIFKIFLLKIDLIWVSIKKIKIGGKNGKLAVFDNFQNLVFVDDLQEMAFFKEIFEGLEDDLFYP